ncbi:MULTISPECIES: ribonuclease HIII [Fictibacillus]|jgi:ribonuclease HIII|uniref:ribonuclease HIII n=1 Tax=Fictibacillus TaxID=1329200 RepID=UPI0018CF896C|nr:MULTISPECIES: ribonuclease HIII [unclassified Fictibacillus]MBH0159828.1 ribonuclease HIII [Fictibacillus sp. 26RED30]MBH0163380.1 ribonuclease HIII [Fictibacillus sp. 7GRE50]
MSHVVKKMTNAEILKMKKELTSVLSAKTPPGAVFSAKLSDCTVTAYQSGKVLFQGKGAEAASQKYSGEVAIPKEKTKTVKPPHQYAPPQNAAELSMIGSDEVGTGDYFGPMTVAAAYVSRENLELVKELGVKDSKHLNDKQIIQIAKELIHTVPYSLLVLNNEKYNELQQKGMTQGKIKAILHNRALQNVKAKIEGEEIEGILVDQFCEPGVYFNYLTREKNLLKEGLYFATKGESIHLSVAAASILARYSFLKEMDKLGHRFNTVIPKGAGPHVDVKAAELVEKYGETVFDTATKKHFANTQKALNLLRKKKI